MDRLKNQQHGTEHSPATDATTVKVEVQQQQQGTATPPDGNGSHQSSGDCAPHSPHAPPSFKTGEVCLTEIGPGGMYVPCTVTASSCIRGAWTYTIINEVTGETYAVPSTKLHKFRRPELRQQDPELMQQGPWRQHDAAQGQHHAAGHQPPLPEGCPPWHGGQMMDSGARAASNSGTAHHYGHRNGHEPYAHDTQMEPNRPLTYTPQGGYDQRPYAPPWDPNAHMGGHTPPNGRYPQPHAHQWDHAPQRDLGRPLPRTSSGHEQQHHTPQAYTPQGYEQHPYANRRDPGRPHAPEADPSRLYTPLNWHPHQQHPPQGPHTPNTTQSGHLPLPYGSHMGHQPYNQLRQDHHISRQNKEPATDQQSHGRDDQMTIFQRTQAAHRRMEPPGATMAQKEIRDIESYMPKYDVSSGGGGMAEKLTVIQRIMQWIIKHMNTYGISRYQSVLADDASAFTLIAAIMFESKDSSDAASKMNSTFHSNWFENDHVDMMDDLVNDVNHRISQGFSRNAEFITGRMTRREAILVMCDQHLLGEHWWRHFWGARDPPSITPLSVLFTFVSLSDVGNEENAIDMIKNLKGSGQIPQNPCVLLAQAKALHMRQQDPQMDSDRGALAKMFLNEPRLSGKNKALDCTRADVLQAVFDHMLPEGVGATLNDFFNRPQAGFGGASINTKNNVTWEEVESALTGLMARWSEHQQMLKHQQRVNQRTPYARPAIAAPAQPPFRPYSRNPGTPHVHAIHKPDTITANGNIPEAATGNCAGCGGQKHSWPYSCWVSGTLPTTGPTALSDCKPPRQLQELDALFRENRFRSRQNPPIPPLTMVEWNKTVSDKSGSCENRNGVVIHRQPIDLDRVRKYWDQAYKGQNDALMNKADSLNAAVLSLANKVLLTTLGDDSLAEEPPHAQLHAVDAACRYSTCPAFGRYGAHGKVLLYLDV